MHYSALRGTGSALPKKTLTNADLEKKIDTSDEWIMKRVGIRKRHVTADSGETTTTLALQAAREALKSADISADDLDLIIVATATPTYHFPSVACELHGGLNITKSIPAFDLNAACAGFVYALSVADQYIRSGTAKKALVVGADALSQLLDWSDRSTCVLFGDGAGAVVLESSQEPGILGTHIHAQGQYHDLIYSENTVFNDQASQHVKMRGNEVFKLAVKKLGDIVEQTLEKSGLSKSDIDWLVPHQANTRIIQATAKRLGVSMDRVVLRLEEQGNTSAASIPLALDYAVREGQIKRGEVLLLEAFGAGLAWGSALIKY